MGVILNLRVMLCDFKVRIDERITCFTVSILFVVEFLWVICIARHVRPFEIPTREVF